MIVSMKGVSLGLVLTVVVLVGCGGGSDPPKSTTTTTCVVANALTGTGSQSVIGTKTVTAIYDSGGTSVSSDPGKRVVVGQSAPPITGWQLAGTVVGPNSGFCTAPIRVTTQIGESTGPATYTIDATAVWPATSSPTP